MLRRFLRGGLLAALLLLLGRKAAALPEALAQAHEALQTGVGMRVLEAHLAFARSRSEA